MTEPVRVLLVDDQELVRAGFATILGAQPGITVVGEAGTGAQAVALATLLAPDVICMDVQMPDMDGLEATRRITADPAIASAVVILTTFHREDYLFEALRAGACGFLLKNSRPQQLVEAVRSAAAGDGLLAPEVTRAVISRFAAGSGPGESGDEDAARPSGSASGDGGRPRPTGPVASPRAPGRGAVAPGPESLTERETQVLRLVARGMTNDEIAAELVLGRATVKTHVSNVLTKLMLRDRVQAVIFAYEHGVAGPT